METMRTEESEELNRSPAQKDCDEILSPQFQVSRSGSEDDGEKQQQPPPRPPRVPTTHPDSHLQEAPRRRASEWTESPPALPNAADCPQEEATSHAHSAITSSGPAMGASHSRDNDMEVGRGAFRGYNSVRRTVVGGDEGASRHSRNDRRPSQASRSAEPSRDAVSKERGGRSRRFSDLAMATQHHSHSGSAPPPWLSALRPIPAAAAKRRSQQISQPRTLPRTAEEAARGPGRMRSDALATSAPAPSPKASLTGTRGKLDSQPVDDTWNEEEDGSQSRSPGKDRTTTMGWSYDGDHDEGSDELCPQVSLAPGAYRISPGCDPEPASSLAIQDEGVNDDIGNVAPANRTSSDRQAASEPMRSQPSLPASPLELSLTRQHQHPFRRRVSDGPDAFLAEANLVVEEPAPALVEAKIIRRKRQICLVLLAILGGTGLLLGLILGLVASPVLSSRARNGAPTESPTSTPTPSPTTELDRDFRSVLPARTLAALDNATSPQHRAYAWATEEDRIPVLHHPSNETARLEHMRRRFALATFYFATGGDSTWRSSSSGAEGAADLGGNATGNATAAAAGNHWLDGRLNECVWTGCMCDVGSTSPRSIDLQAHSLVGPIPPEIGLLGDGLIELVLSQNALTGTVPTEIGALSRLQVLDLEENLLGLDIPTEIGGMASLEVLKLNSNGLVGNIPKELGRLNKLKTLALGENLLRSSLPTELCFLNASLEVLALSSNAFTGPIPSCLGSLIMLSDLRLNKNQLVGPIPSSFGALSSLSALDLSSNVLTGQIIPQLGQLVQLVDLRLYWNRLGQSLPTELGRLTRLKFLHCHDNALTGPLPSELGRLSQVEELLLQGKDADGLQRLQSSIPTELGLLTSLEVLDLSVNLLTGPIPVEFGMLESLRELRLSSNRLNGTIPTVVGQLSKLEVLHLAIARLPDEYTLTGSIPSELGSLASLRELDLRLGNFAQSSIPSTLGSLSHLVSLLLSNSRLAGSVPTELGRLTNLIALDLFGNSLSGAIPTELGRLVELEALYLAFNRFNGTIPTELGSLTSLRDMNVGAGNQDLAGSVPAELCQVKVQNGWDLVVDCDAVACACDCDCSDRDDLYY